MASIVVVLVLVLVATAQGKLPSFIKACSRYDPNLNECAARHGQEAIPYIAKGDTKHKLPPLDPMTIPEIKLEQGLSVTSRNVQITGLKDSIIDKIRIDLERQHAEAEITIPRMQVVSDYEVTGKILSLPIQGSGVSNFTFVGNKAKHSFDYDLVERNGKRYGTVKNMDLQFDTNRAYFYLSNLFNGDKTLGEAMNAALNDNWQQVVEEMKPDILVVVKTIIQQMMDNIGSLFTYDEFLPETV